jgi:hypothetical protein
MRSASALLLALWLAASPIGARADAYEEPITPARQLCHDADHIGYTDGLGHCIAGWDGLGEIPDAGGYLIRSPRSGEPVSRRSDTCASRSRWPCT